MAAASHAATQQRRSTHAEGNRRLFYMEASVNWPSQGSSNATAYAAHPAACTVQNVSLLRTDWTGASEQADPDATWAITIGR